jgi:hypothetical protein
MGLPPPLQVLPQHSEVHSLTKETFAFVVYISLISSELPALSSLGIASCIMKCISNQIMIDALLANVHSGTSAAQSLVCSVTPSSCLYNRLVLAAPTYAIHTEIQKNRNRYTHNACIFTVFSGLSKYKSWPVFHHCTHVTCLDIGISTTIPTHDR